MGPLTSYIGGPVPLESRQGRHKQRYGQGGERLVAGCIPVRYLPGKHGIDSVEVLLISRRGGKGWVFPKGGWEDDEPVEAAAERETVEEAGVRGYLDLPMLGTYCFQSAKEARRRDAHQGRCIAHVFVMRVAEELDQWPEQTVREREWFSLQEALRKCCHAWMREALSSWVAQNGWGAALNGNSHCHISNGKDCVAVS